MIKRVAFPAPFAMVFAAHVVIRAPFVTVVTALAIDRTEPVAVVPALATEGAALVGVSTKLVTVAAYSSPLQHAISRFVSSSEVNFARYLHSNLMP